jgi:hypothetical protein
MALRPRVRAGALTLLLLTIAACSPVWFLTRSDELALPLRLEDGLGQSVALVPKFPGRRYGVFLRFDRTVTFEEMQCLVGYLWVDKCPTPPIPVQLNWMVSTDNAVVVQGTAAPRFSNVGWANDFVEVILGEFYPESGTMYQVSTRVIGNGGRLADLRPKLLVLSYYNALDKSIHVRPGSDSPSLPNYSFHRTAYGGR